MSSSNPHRVETGVAREHWPDPRDLSVLPRERGEASVAPVIVASNVVPFARLRREAPAANPAVDIRIDPAERPAAQPIDRAGQVRIAGLFALSLAVHAGFYVLFNREPEPMASIGLEAISVEIVLGANTPAGLAVTPGENVAQNTPADAPDPTPADTETATAKLEKAEEAKPVGDARSAPPDAKPAEARPDQVRTEVASETPPEAKPDQVRTEIAKEAQPEAQTQQVAALPLEPTPSPRAELAVAPDEPVKPETVRPPVKPELQPKPVQKRETRPKQDRETKPKQERAGPRTRTASTQPEGSGPRSNAASGVGPGRSQNSANYSGIVFAHLARHKQFPPEARSRGEQGSATVSFSLDGSGRVTRVALARSSGFASLDREAQSMVRRASPFPAPPDGRAASFTAPVGFRIQ